MKKTELSEARLSEREELQLIKYTDNECGFFGRLRAKYLIARNPRAAEFVESLNSLSNEFPSTEFAVQDMRVDLWEKISKRIDQEEKAEFYLGTRATTQEIASPSFEWSKLNWGLSSGLAAACLAIFFIYSSGKDLNQSTASNQYNKNTYVNAALNSTVSNKLGSNSDFTNISNISVSPSRANSSKLDWLRSHGKIKMIQDNDNRLPVIWVNRNLNSTSLNSGKLNSGRRIPVQGRLSHPSHELFDLEDNSVSTPIILKDNSPKALSVIDKSANKIK